MLALTRRKFEGVILTDGTDTIRIVVSQSNTHAAKIGIDAPPHWRIVRTELLTRQAPRETGLPAQ